MHTIHNQTFKAHKNKFNWIGEMHVVFLGKLPVSKKSLSQNTNSLSHVDSFKIRSGLHGTENLPI